MKNFIFLAIFIVLSSAVSATAQEPVTISKEAAIKCLENSDKVIAFEIEITAKDKAISDLKDEITRLKIEFAKSAQRASDLEQQQIADREFYKFVIQNLKRPNKYGINLF